MFDTIGATAPAESTPAPAADVAVHTPNPISTEPEGQPAPEAKPEGKPDKVEAKAETKPLTARQALEKAALKVEKDNAEPKPEVKTDPKAKADPKAETKPAVEKPRGEHGHFAAKESDKGADTKAAPKTAEGLSSTAEEAPKWIKPHEKAAWSTMAPEQRAIAERRDHEAAEGVAAVHEKYRPVVERDAALNEFHEMAQKHGTTVKSALANYTKLDALLERDFLAGLEQVCQTKGQSLRAVAAHILNQKPEEVASRQDSTILELRQQVSDLTKKVGSVSNNFQQQQSNAVGKEVADFAAAHPRFEELHEDIAFFLKTRCQGDLEQAYELAERLNPAPATPAGNTEASKAPVIDLSLQTEKGSKSINGSPSPGSSPGKRQPSNSIKESLRKAMAAAS